MKKDRPNNYDFSWIEKEWQKYWEDNKVFGVSESKELKKYYVLDMFPYPSGSGLHVGHVEGYMASDILARFKKAQGFNVLHPMGWDAFGLPAEQHAIATGIHPSINTSENIANFKRQIKSLGSAIDWESEINTTDPSYVKWTQWIFLKLFQKGLAYVDERPVLWCPELKSVLANEEVVNGLSERGGYPVERRNLRQWILKITAYADKLLDGLEDIDWPDSTKRQQIAWIGRSEGAEIEFEIEFPEENTESFLKDDCKSLKVFTTRPDTLFGVTYVVIAPEHPLVPRLTTKEQESKVNSYVKTAANKSDLDRTDLAKTKTGVFSGSYVVNPINGKKVPIWISDYVLVTYGTGVVMAVPAHDERDFEFAKQFDLPVVPVIEKESGETQLPFIDSGVMINSGSYNGKKSESAKAKIVSELQSKNCAKHSICYKLRDWLFSRQRYWGEPVPIVWVKKADYDKVSKNSPFAEFLPENPVCYSSQSSQNSSQKSFDSENADVLYAIPLSFKHLPLNLPEIESYQPSGFAESPLANEKTWTNVRLNVRTGQIISAITGQNFGDCLNQNNNSGDFDEKDWIFGVRETNTMPQWAGSCWYYLRYLSPKDDKRFVSKDDEMYWKTPDMYIGGAEHAVLHLLYARFWHKFLYDQGELSTPEPFTKLFHQGLIVDSEGNKMSKSLGNVVNPDDIIRQFGTDALRLYILFLGPLEAMKPWNTQSIEGVSRFLKKIWRLLLDENGNLKIENPSFKSIDNSSDENQTLLSQKSRNLSQEIANLSQETTNIVYETILKVTEDIETLRLNTAISQLMICLNHFQKLENIPLILAEIFLKLLAPFAPHICEELWFRISSATFDDQKSSEFAQKYSKQNSICNYPWPNVQTLGLKYKKDDINIVLQVNGKFRATIQVPKSSNENEIITIAKSDEKISNTLKTGTLLKTIYVPGKLVNFVI